MARRRDRERAGKAGGCIGILFGGIFVLVGGGVFVGLTVMPMLKWADAQSWPEVPCQVLSSEVSTSSSSDGTTYGVHVHYEYVFDGQRHESHQFDFADIYSSGYDAKAAVVAQYPPGLQTVCYVDPAQPDQAVLVREFSYAYLFGCFGLLFVGAGLLAGTAMARGGMRMARTARERSVYSQGTQMPAAAVDAPGRVLESTITPKKTLATASIFTVFWYLILGAVGYGFFSDGISVGDDLIALFVVGIMSLAGLLGVAGIIKGFLGLWNPRVRLQMDPGDLRLGAVVRIQWQLEGDVSKLTALRIYLKGTESATYRRGTTTSTDHSVFDKIVVAEAAAQGDMVSGHVEFAMPEFTMHSLDLPNNKITWVLRVEGSIPKWPDVEEEFPVTVHPMAVPGTEGPPHA